MAIAEAGRALVRRFEGLRLEAYRCPSGTWTVGYGHTAGAAEGQTVTEEEAEALLNADLEEAEAAVREALGGTPAGANELAAMVSLAFNIGAGAFRRSSVARRHKAGDRAGAAAAFLMWTRADGRVLQGLVRRRQAEMELYLTPDAPAAEAVATTPQTPPRRGLGRSRTLAGGIAAGAGGVAVLAEAVGEGIAAVQRGGAGFTGLPLVGTAVAVLILAGAALAVWARIDDWRRGRR
jgi:lysozyme